MKTHLKKASLLMTGLMVGGKLFAQSPDTMATNKNYVQPFSGDGAFRTWSIGVNGGLLTPYTIFGPNGSQDFRNPTSQLGYGAYIKKQILPAFGIQADFFRGKVSGENGQPGTPAAFETKLNYAASLSANITLANINWMHHQSAIRPYVTAGWGMMGYKPVLNPDGGSPVNFKSNDESITEYFIPVGLGLKIGLGSGVNLDLGYNVNFVGSDNFDGNKTGSTNDRFSYAHIGLEFALGGGRKPELASYNPVNSMRTEYLWKNAQTKQMLQAQIDAEKANSAQLRSDLDATKADLAKLTTDSDGDGVVDVNDKCPNTPAGTAVDGSGCPLAKPVVVVTEEDRRVVNEAIKNLEFDLGKATIRAKSYPSLERVARLLVDKNFSLKLAGHTDNTGSKDLNMRLSKDRAESVKTFLVEKGANPSRIEATGYGQTQPIASNKTAAGRQKNRRVEFTLY
ncbi:OmpA family protein [Mucilaginibacter achroorhodeus]|uniref:OmpA family protein n=1 Tax=Mucilaginibacter achroorhodeus TaxID=2599294 RepID=A0A563U4A1_9SPHI|nr:MULTISPECIES: OmpA family protein [Mucilaginibacter]QXV64358.1 OmpA family protein [Mucilaginibacter sp. 21P]TWR26152.1 OmpA family protein [Mucilaginibacter achroorhodeus]